MSAQPPRQSRGKQLRLSDDALEDLTTAQVMAADVDPEWQHRRVREGGKPEYAGLLDAEPEDETE